MGSDRKKLLHTPEGVRDIYHFECKRKKAIEEKLHHVLALYGYQDIETPAFEFFDIFNSDTGTVSSREMFKFFDRNNNTLVLRPDMTPSIARSAAKYYHDCLDPLRLSYIGHTFQNHHSYQGKAAERTELGVEHINDDSPEADAEAVVMMIDCFLAAGLRDFRIELGQTAFCRGVLEGLPVSDETRDRIHELIGNKNSLGMELLLEDLEMEEDLRRILVEYNDLYGGRPVLDAARDLTRTIATSAQCQRAIDRLSRVYDLICLYGYQDYIGFDLGMVDYYDYYTGILFRGYTYGTGEAIGKGGRYDSLLAQFGKEAPAIGFTILIDELMLALSGQKIPVPTSQYDYVVFLYERQDMAEAISAVSLLRQAGIRTELTMLSPDRDRKQILSFVEGQGAGKALILKDGEVEVFDFRKAEKRQVDLDQFKKADLKEEFGRA